MWLLKRTSNVNYNIEKMKLNNSSDHVQKPNTTFVYDLKNFIKCPKMMLTLL